MAAIERAAVVSQRWLTKRHSLLWLEAPQIACEARPGQFVHVRVREGPLPLLRRPFAVAWVEGRRIALVVEERGLGSGILAHASEGQSFELLGPLGNGFSRNVGGRRRILVAGGVGVAPLLFLAQRLTEAGEDFSFIVGARTKSLLPLPEEFLRRLPPPLLTTEDGSEGFKGTAVDALRRELEGSNERVFVHACGPLGMTRALKELQSKIPFDGEVSLETQMGCGIGACRGCAIPVSEGGRIRYLRACVEGPVFPLDKLVL